MTTVADLQAARSCGGLVFLVCSSGDDPYRIVRQWPLQPLCFIPRRASFGVGNSAVF